MSSLTADSKTAEKFTSKQSWSLQNSSEVITRWNKTQQPGLIHNNT